MDLDLSVDRSSDVPVGAQLTARLREGVRSGDLGPGDQLPSVRALADAAAVNVNTARAVYQRLESEGFVRSEQGRGTFVAGDPGTVRRRLHNEIAMLESELVHRPLTPGTGQPDRTPGGRLLSTDELTAVRDSLLNRLQELDAERHLIRQRLDRLREPAADSSPRASTSKPTARVRWVSG